MEHLQHFGLSLDPFQIEPDLRFYYDSALHKDAQRRVERGLRQSKGLSILAGESGTGKSLLARRLLGGLEEEVFEASLMVMLPGAADAQSVVTRFARHLEIEDVSDDPSRMMGQVYEQLAMVREDGRHAVLILDDAHLLGPAALAEVGALLSLEYEERRLVSILLVGLPELDADVAGDRSLGQRVDIRVRLAPLDFDSATAYLANRLEVAGGDPSIIPPEAVTALFKHSGGRPRLMNTLADNALFEAYLAGRHQIDASDVERAAGDLGLGSGSGLARPPSAPPPVAAAALEAPELQLSRSSELPGDPLSDAPLELSPEVEPAAGPPVASRQRRPVDVSAELTAELPGEAAIEDPMESGLELSLEAPEVDAAENLALDDAELDFDSLLDADPPVEVEVATVDEAARTELDLEFEVGPEAEAPRQFAEETRLMLEDEAQGFQTGEMAALELGEPLGPGDEYELADDGRAIELADDSAPSPPNPGECAEATRLVLPDEQESLLTAEVEEDGDEIEALFDQLLDD